MKKNYENVLPFDPTFKSGKYPQSQKWEKPREARQPQESPLKRWYLEKEAKKNEEKPEC